MTDQTTQPARLPRDPTVYMAVCDKRIASLQEELNTCTSHEQWEQRRDIVTRIAAYRTTREIFEEIAQ